MDNVAVNRASELSEPARAAIEGMLGRALGDDEQISVLAFGAHPAPTGAVRAESSRRLQAALDVLDEKAVALDPQELQDAIDEAMNHVRPGRA